MASSNGDRIVVLIDMDCFFCQVETKLQPEFKGKPLAVVQYNQWQLGGIIAVNYEAREYGVTRHMRGEEAKEKCPDIVLASVPCLRGKSDTSRYRTAGREVIDVIRKHSNLVERASVDEAYLDVTDVVEKRMSTRSVTPKELIAQLSNTFVVGYSEVGKNDEEQRSKGMETWISNIFEELEDVQSQKLAIAGVIVEELRTDIFEKTGYKCSAGIAQNKILAKLACGLHKPNRQTILPAAAVGALYSTLPIKKVRNLGGKFGDVVVESLNCNVMGDLLQYSLQYLQKRFDDKTGLWLYNIARGVDNDPVTMRLISKSVGSCKKFPGKQAIVSLDVLKHWAGELAADVCERLEQDLEENVRCATLLTISYHYYQNRNTVSQSRSCTLNSYNPEKMAARCVDIITKSTQCPIAFLGISAGKFVPAKGRTNFMNFFKSTELKMETKTNVQLENKVECKDLLASTKEPITTALKTNEACCSFTDNNEMLDCHSENVKTDVDASKKDVQNTKPYFQLRETNANVKIDDSPTSRRVKNLIESLNRQNNAKVLSKSERNNCNVNESVGLAKIKESFFMSYFNKNENQFMHDRCTDRTELITCNDKGNFETLYNNLQENNFKKNLLNNECKLGKKNSVVNERKTSDVQEFNFITEKVRNCENKIPSPAGNNCIIPSTSHEIKEKENSPSVIANENNKEILVQSSSIRLQELFPDLNNIDPSIVPLLPLDLQKEAKLYITPLHKKNVKSTEDTAKSSKSKSNKCKATVSKGKKGNNMDSFLIKGSLCNSTDLPSKRCTQCNAMILIVKYDEHIDFHIAENLQRELNNPVLNKESVKRKIDTCGMDTNSAKRRSNEDILKPNENCKSITSFFRNQDLDR